MESEETSFGTDTSSTLVGSPVSSPRPCGKSVRSCRALTPLPTSHRGSTERNVYEYHFRTVLFWILEKEIIETTKASRALQLKLIRGTIVCMDRFPSGFNTTRWRHAGTICDCARPAMPQRIPFFCQIPSIRRPTTAHWNYSDTAAPGSACNVTGGDAGGGWPRTPTQGRHNEAMRRSSNTRFRGVVSKLVRFRVGAALAIMRTGPVEMTMEHDSGAAQLRTESIYAVDR